MKLRPAPPHCSQSVVLSPCAGVRASDAATTAASAKPRILIGVTASHDIVRPVRKIDIFNHIYPATYYTRLMQIAPDYKDIGKRMRGIPMLADLDVRFRVMDGFDGYQQVLSLPTPPIENVVSGPLAAELATAANDGMAELVAKYPDRFPGFIASIAYDDADAAAREAVRALDQLGARGIQMFTNVHGTPITAPRYLPIFEALAARDLPIWMHPYRGADMPDYKSEDRSQYEIWWTFGWPYETSAAMARLVFEGYFDRFPSLKIITHHMGAMAPYFAGRVGPGWDQLGARTSDANLAAVLGTLRKRPLDYFKMFYADTALFGAYDATACGLAFFGADHVLFASDAPFDPEKGPMYIRETIAIVDRLPISEAEREQIYWRNAVALLKLPSGQEQAGA
jgi:aminocarboxymuconate-semialdehyde decarboxylase